MICVCVCVCVGLFGAFKIGHRRGFRASFLTSAPPDDGLGVLEASLPIWACAATCSATFQAKLFSRIVSL